MKEFKRLMSTYHTQNKMLLHGLYTDKQVYFSSLSSFDQPVEDEKLFEYRTISFQFTGTGFRTPEQMVLHVWIPEDILLSREIQMSADIQMSEEIQMSKDIQISGDIPAPMVCCGPDNCTASLKTAYEDWLLRLLGGPVNALSEGFQNDHKDTREKTCFTAQEPGPVVLTRNGCLYGFPPTIICDVNELDSSGIITATVKIHLLNKRKSNAVTKSFK